MPEMMEGPKGNEFVSVCNASFGESLQLPLLHRPGKGLQALQSTEGLCQFGSLSCLDQTDIAQ